MAKNWPKNLESGGSKVAQHSAYIPMIEGLNPTPDTRKEKMGENSWHFT